MWKNHLEIEEIFKIQAKTKSENRNERYEDMCLLSDDETVSEEMRETEDSSKSGEDSDVDSGDDDSVEVISSHNKFAALADDN